MEPELSPFILTDFSDHSKWESLLNEVKMENAMGFAANVEPVSDQRFAGAGPAEVVEAYPDAIVIFIVDDRALETKEILCVDGENSMNTFHTKVDDLWIVENNVSIGNLLFQELMEQVGEDGILVGM